MEELARVLSVVCLAILPGAWLSYSRRLRGISGWDRFGLAISLSIPMTCAQYFILALIGTSVDRIPWILVVGNIGALAPLIRGCTGTTKDIGRPHFLGVIIPVVVIVASHSLSPVSNQWSHNWMHADLIYALLEAPMAPQEWQLAGVGAGYPWFGHLQRTAMVQALDMSPILAVRIINPIMVLGFSVLAVLLVRAVGGGKLAMFLAPTLALFATNAPGVAGRTLTPLLSEDLARFHYLMGDPRYDAVALKFLYINTNQLGLIMTAGLLLLLLQSGACFNRRIIVQSLAMMAGIGLVYPLYLPVASVIILCLGLVCLWSIEGEWRERFLNFAGLALAVVIVGAVTYYLVLLQTPDRTGGAGISPNAPGKIWRHGLATACALMLPAIAWVGLLLLRRTPRREHFCFLTLVIISAGLMSVLIHIPNFHNEYKFVLVAAIAGAPLLALFMERLWVAHRAGIARSTTILLAFLVGSTGLHGLSWQLFPPEIQQVPPKIRVLDLEFNGLQQTLRNENGLGEAMNAVREHTDPGTPVLIGATDFHVTPFTQRPVYIPYNLDSNLLGLAMVTEYLLADVKGFDRALVEARSERLERFISPKSPTERSAAFSEISEELGSKIAVIVDESAQPDLSGWLAAEGASVLHATSRYSAWKFD